jgi:hypothetical protein
MVGLALYAKRNLNLGGRRSGGVAGGVNGSARTEALLAKEVAASPVNSRENLGRDTTVMMMAEDFPELPPLES